MLTKRPPMLTLTHGIRQGGRSKNPTGSAPGVPGRAGAGLPDLEVEDLVARHLARFGGAHNLHDEKRRYCPAPRRPGRHRPVIT